MSNDGPLKGIKVLDLTCYQNGPACTRRLCDYGATVIKLEVPSGGDPMRGIVKLKDNYDLLFEVFNRGKRSVALDLRKPESKEVMRRLVMWADVLAENFRPGTLKGWGYGYEQLKAWNPHIIYAANSGFGPTGRLSHLGSFDMTCQAVSGAMVAQGGGPSHPPVVIEHCIADEVGALNFAFAILSAVVSRLKTGKGQMVETSQLGAMCEYQANGTSLAAHLHYGRSRDDGLPPFSSNPTQNYFQAGDQKWFVIGIPVRKFWENLCRVIGREDLSARADLQTLRGRAKHWTMVKDELTKTFGSQPREHWLEKLHSVGVIAGPVNSYADVVDEQHFWDNQYLATTTHPHLPELGEIKVQGKAIQFHGTPASTVPATGELLGESTEPVLTSLGFSTEEIAGLVEAGATQEVGAHFSDRSYPLPTRKPIKSRL